MKLNVKSLADRESWTNRGYVLPTFDLPTVRQKTVAEPTWLHFGAGNIFRAFPAVAQQRLLDAGLTDRGIIVAEAFDEEIIDRAYTPFDNLSLMVTLNADGNIGKEVVASVVHALKASEEAAELARIVRAPSLQMISFTITEKGYAVRGADGKYLPWIAADLEAIPERPASLISLLTRLLHERYKAGGYPLALVSMDNCSHNGTRLYDAVMTFAQAWAERDLVETAFLTWLDDPAKVAFTWSMIDKITPRPSDVVQNLLRDDGYEDAEIIITARKTYTASFVNAEPTEYLVIEDRFPNGRPPLDQAGVLFTDRGTVDKIETMKVTTCLNPLHTILAIYGCLLNHPTIAEAIADKHLGGLVRQVGYREGMPVVVDPGVIKPDAFIDTVLEKRFTNPYLPDTPQRIATDTSQKIPVRFGETLKAYLRRGKGEERDLTGIPLVIAGWLRYLLGVDDEGKPMTLSPDPQLETLQKSLAGIKLGDRGPFDEQLKPLLANVGLFGVDLNKIGLAERVIADFTALVTGPGAVRRTLASRYG